MIAALAALVVSAEARTAIDAAHADLARDFSNRSLAAWTRVLHPDLRVWWSGKLRYDKAGYLKLAQDEVAAFQDPLEAKISTVALEPDGRDVISVTREQTCFRLPDRSKALRTICYDQTYTERWRRGGGGWQAVEIRYPGQMAQTLDGKPAGDAELKALGL